MNRFFIKNLYHYVPDLMALQNHQPQQNSCTLNIHWLIEGTLLKLPDIVLFLNHLKVKRIAKAKVQTIELLTGDGWAYQASITIWDKQQFGLNLVRANYQANPRPTHIYSCACSNNTIDWMLEKACELGASHFSLINSQYSQALTQEKFEQKYAHWQAIIQSACQQSGNNHSMQLHYGGHLQQLLANLPANTEHSPMLVAMQNSLSIAQYFSQLKQENYLSNSITQGMLIGSEGGFSIEEVKQLQQLQQQNHINLVSLGNHILRAETALVAMLSYLQTQLIG